MKFEKNMKRQILPVLFFLFLCSCGGSNKDYLLEKSEIETAVIKANDCERELHKNRNKFTSKEEVYNYFKNYFSEELARNMTDYTWGINGFAAVEYALIAPKKAFISRMEDKKAEVFFETDAGLAELWGFKKYTIQKLKKEKGKWIIYESMTSDIRPKSVD